MDQGQVHMPRRHNSGNNFIKVAFASLLVLFFAVFSHNAYSTPLLLDWDAQTWTPTGNTNLSETFNVGGRNIVVTFGGNVAGLDSAGAVVSPQLDNTNTGGLLPPELSLVVGTDYIDLSDPQVTVTLDFSAYRGGVSNVSFTIFDVDESGAFIDEVTVTAQTVGGVVDPTSISVGPAITVLSANTIVGVGSTPPNSSDANGTYTFAQSGITEINLIYRNTTANTPAFQWINIHDISFEAVQADISLVKDVDNATPSAGTNVVYTVTVSNDGPDEGTGLEVTDQLPAGLTYVSDTGGGAYDNTTGVWTIGSLASGANTTLQITALVNATGPYDNVAELTAATSDDLDSTPGNNDPTEDDQDNALITPAVQADLSLTKVANPTEVMLGDNVTYTINVTNDGPADTTGVTVTDLLPGGLAYVSHTASVGSYDPATGLWTIGAMAATAVETLQIVAQTLATGDYTNTAQVASSSLLDPDSTPGNNDPAEDDQDSAVVTTVLIGVAKSVSAGPVNNGNGTFTLDYSIIIENFGSGNISNLQVTDALNTTFAGATGFVVDAINSTDFTVNAGYDGQADPSLLNGTDTLAVGTSGTVTLTVTVTPGGNLGPYSNIATATGVGPGGTPVTDDSQLGIDPDPDNDGDPRNNNDPTPVNFSESPVIGIAKRVSTAPVADGIGGFDLSYTLFVENLGDVAFNQLQIVDDLSATYATADGFTITTITSADFTVNGAYDGNADTNVLLGTDTLAVGGSGELVININVRPGTNLGPYLNTATVNGLSPAGTPVSDQSTDGTDPDPDNDNDPGNNMEPTPVSFVENPRIGTAKSVSSGPVNNGDGTYTVGYDITVENFGDAALAGVQITDDLANTFAAAGSFSIISLTSSDFVINPGFNGIADTNLLDGSDTLAIGAVGTVNVVVTIDPAGNLGQYNNTATGSGTSPAGTLVQDVSTDGIDPDPDGDNDPGNNDAPTPVVLAENPGIGIAKRVATAPVSNNNGTFTLSYIMVVENFGDVALSDLQITDDLAAAFDQATTFVINAVQSADFATNGAFNGVSDTNLLAGTDVLAIGQTGELEVTFTLTPGGFAGPYLNTAVASGNSPAGAPVEDDSTDGIDPDPDNDGNPGNNGDPTPVSFAIPEIIVTKRADPSTTSTGGLVRYTVVIENAGGGALNDITLQDLIPAGFTYAANSARLVGRGPLVVSGRRPVVFDGIDLNGGETATVNLHSACRRRGWRRATIRIL